MECKKYFQSSNFNIIVLSSSPAQLHEVPYLDLSLLYMVLNILVCILRVSRVFVTPRVLWEGQINSLT